MGRSAAATRRPSSANKLYVEHAFLCKTHIQKHVRTTPRTRTVSITSICIPNALTYPRTLSGTRAILGPVPKINISIPEGKRDQRLTRVCTYTKSLPGFGTTTSKTSQCVVVHASHGRGPSKLGTSHNRTLPSRNMTGPVHTRPSASVMPAGPTEVTWTGGGTSEASMLVRTVGRSGAWSGRVVWMARSRSWCGGRTADSLNGRGVLHGRGRRAARRAVVDIRV